MIFNKRTINVTVKYFFENKATLQELYVAGMTGKENYYENNIVVPEYRISFHWGLL